MIRELRNWTKVSNEWSGHYRYAISLRYAYELFVEYWKFGSPIETAKSSLWITRWQRDKEGHEVFERKRIARGLPVCILLDVAYEYDMKRQTDTTTQCKVSEKMTEEKLIQAKKLLDKIKRIESDRKRWECITDIQSVKASLRTTLGTKDIVVGTTFIDIEELKSLVFARIDKELDELKAQFEAL